MLYIVGTGFKLPVTIILKTNVSGIENPIAKNSKIEL